MKTTLICLSVLLVAGLVLLLAGYLVMLTVRHRLRSLFTVETLTGLPCAVSMKIVADASYLAGYLRGRSAPVGPGSQE
mgnify:CR=1 FL=1